MDQELSVDFYFGDNSEDIKIFDYNELKGYKGILKYVKLYKIFYWQKGLMSLAFKNYSNYILLGEYFCITHWLLFIVLKIKGKKIILWSHGWYGNEGIGKRIIKKMYFSFADKILLYGDYAKQLMIKENIAGEKLDIIYNSLDFEEQDRIYRSLSKTNIYKDHFKNNNKVVFYIGRLQKRKKIEQIIFALKELQKDEIFINLVIIGKGEKEEDLRNLVENNNLGSYVWFYGATYKEEEIAELINNADLCISPGNVGLTAMHSLVYGTPVITHSNFKNQMPEFEAIVPGVSGDFFVEDSLDDLKSKIKDWIVVRKDEETISENCRKVIKDKYNPDYQIEIIKRIINDFDEK
ncbi:glycosyltransferase family 4 protein [Chryseobacterium sp. T16E-39]|uniref:glycosyltransferase family 4 protein n=1 Tax=Chryseobacterium sp. T16E-39 TaxID=2015076 RepID=UPI001E636DE1|nr:glycosyltransferase family 4 protein [Chryseobacterium sp. T16E-39]